MEQKGSTSFPELSFTSIPGAPKLSQPILIMGDTKPVMGEGMGWASPAFYDVDGDGKKDLLIGEFGSGLEDKGIAVGNFLRVYKNIGTKNEPRFDDFYTYLRPNKPDRTYSTGTPFSIETWCCLGFTPRIIDLDNDGYEDLISGQYFYGVTMFKGCSDGFLPGVKIPQSGDHMIELRQPWNDTSPWNNSDNWEYWIYSSAAFGDFNGDGLADMITGGSTLRMSKNIGTEKDPAFGHRVLLLDTAGIPLRMPVSAGALLASSDRSNNGSNMVPTVYDWDGDGILDLLVTDSYSVRGSQVITFFKGVLSDEKIKFIPGVPLFTSRGGDKAFPGSWPHISVTDWNNDGVNDLIIGASVATLGGEFDYDLSWNWEEETNIIKKNPFNFSGELKQKIKRQFDLADSIKSDLLDKELKGRNPVTREFLIKNYYGKEEYRNLKHQGYIYVMLGKKE